MRYRLLVLAASGSALALAMMSFPAVGASSAARAAAKAPHITAASHMGATADAASARVPIPTLYSQLNHDAGNGDSSQNFEPAFSAFDGQLADDFTVPAGHTWTIQEIDLTGTETGGPVVAVGVEIYADSGSGTPGGAMSFQTVKSTDSLGHLVIKLGAGAVTLGAGAYWLSVYAEQDFSFHGQWYWETRTLTHANGSLWQNPGNGFGTGCTAWTASTTCIPGSGPGDAMFRLRGTHT